jgi:lantibiotic biosynthesis protein
MPAPNRSFLSPSLAAETHRALEGISRQLLDVPISSWHDGSLESGLSGAALFHVGMDRIFPKRGHAIRATELLESAMESGINDESAGLYAGLAGLGWAIAHLATSADFDPCCDVDSALTQLVETEPWRGPFDLINGLVGIGVYALERLPIESGKALLRLVLDRLSELAEPQDHGVAWSTDPTWIAPQFRGERQVRHFDAGLAHGTPGVISLLAQAQAAKVGSKRTERLLRNAVKWLVAEKLAQNPRGHFPSWRLPKAPPQVARTAWCYGDLGNSMVLFTAGRALRDATITRVALRIARAAASRPARLTGVGDPWLCHGAMGFAHVMHWFFRQTDDPVFGRAAARWARRALAMLSRDMGTIDRLSRKPHRSGQMGLLEGAMGIGLALASALDPNFTGWERILLMPNVRSWK